MSDIETTLKETFNDILKQIDTETGNIKFVENDVDTLLTQIINLYSQITGKTIARGDPVRLFINCIAYMLASQRAGINYTGRMNLLRYAVNDYLDELGYLFATERLPAQKATTTAQITLSKATESAATIPAGIRITAGDNVFFTLKNDVIIPAGETQATVQAECTTEGDSGNGYLAGQLNQIVDQTPYMLSIENITESTGGADTEDDDSYRERIHLAPESFSTAGPSGAYEYWAKTASALISDVAVTTLKPGEVDIYVLLQNGDTPSQELLNKVYDVCSEKTIRPLNDKLVVTVPEIVDYELDVTYYISDSRQTEAATLKTAIEQAAQDWVTWTRSEMGRDINPDRLIEKMRAAGARRVENTPAYKVIKRGEYNGVLKTANPVQVAVASSVKVAFGDIEND